MRTLDPDPGPRVLARRVMGFAREHLGPASEQVLQDAKVQAVALRRREVWAVRGFLESPAQ